MMTKDKQSNPDPGRWLLILFVLMLSSQSGWAELLQTFTCPSDNKTYQASEVAHCPDADAFISLTLGFPSFNDARRAIITQDVKALAEASKQQTHIFWEVILKPEKSQQSERVRQWARETQSKACEDPESSVCNIITAGLLSYFLLSPEAEYFIHLPDVAPVALQSLDTLHKTLFSINPESPVAGLRRQVIANITTPSAPPAHSFNCHLGSFINTQTDEAQLFLNGDHSKEILNFIWFGPNLPSQYVKNLLEWADTYSDLAVVLWYSSMDLDDRDLHAYQHLSGLRANLQARNIKDARLDLIEVEGLNAGKILDNILALKKDISPGIRYASASDFARVALIARGSQALKINDQALPEKTMIYFDLDVTFAKTCGFPPLVNWEGKTYIDLYHLEKAEKFNLLYPPVDILAAKDANHPDIMTMLGYLADLYNDVITGKRSLKNTRLPIAFDGAMDDVVDNNPNPPHRFPVLWNLPLHGSDQIWKDDPKSLFSKKWKDEFSDYLN